MKTQGFTLIEMLFALFLSGLISVGLFEAVATLTELYQREHGLLHFQTKVQFLNLFFRQKIALAGDTRCLVGSNQMKPPFAKRFSAQEALSNLGISIAADTDLLQLSECILYQGQSQFLPLDFFVANTSRKNSMGNFIPALYIKFGNHRREELVSGLSEFLIDIDDKHLPTDDHPLVQIHYLLSQVSMGQVTQPLYWFQNAYFRSLHHEWVQPGEIDVAVRKAV